MVAPSRRARTVWRQRHRRSETGGQALAELALVVPLLLMLLVGLGDWARLYTTAIGVETGARDAAMYGGFDSSYWLDTNVAGVIGEMERRACLTASRLADYEAAADEGTCANPAFVDASGNPMAPATLSGIATQAEAVAKGILIQPPGVNDCADPADDAVCQVHVRLKYTFRMLLGGVGIPGLIEFPATFDIYREVTVAVNDFPEAAP